MKKFAVVGHPISHSKSPVIHRQFAKQFNIDIEYERCDVEAHEFVTFVSSFFESGGVGLNVTLPHKESAFKMAEVLSSRAKTARAVNTLLMKDGKLFGDNTDGAGLIADLKDQNVALKNKSVLLFGAGGAARGVLYDLLNSGVASIVIANRTIEKAQAIVDEFGSPLLSCSDLDSLSDHYDIVINSTSCSVTGEIPQVNNQVLCHTEFAYDMYYSDRKTSFNLWVEQNSNAKTSDGLGMLVGQAAESFFIWHHATPATSEVKKCIRDGLSA